MLIWFQNILMESLIELVRMEVKMPEDMIQFLQDEKKETGNTVNSIMNMIIKDFIFGNLDLLTGDQANRG